MAFTDLFRILPCLVLFAFFQGIDGAYHYYSYRYYYYYSYYSISGGVISAIALGIGAVIFVVVITVVCCCRAATRRNQMGGVIYTNGGNQQAIISTTNTVPGMYPTQPYPGQYNAGVPYAPTGLYTAPGQQFTYPPPGQQYTNAPLGQQYTNPLPSYEETTAQKAPMQ